MRCKLSSVGLLSHWASTFICSTFAAMQASRGFVSDIWCLFFQSEQEEVFRSRYCIILVSFNALLFKLLHHVVRFFHKFNCFSVFETHISINPWISFQLVNTTILDISKTVVESVLSSVKTLVLTGRCDWSRAVTWPVGHAHSTRRTAGD